MKGLNDTVHGGGGGGVAGGVSFGRAHEISMPEVTQ